MEIYVARQPIFNKNKKIHAYELLFRDSMSNFFPDVDANKATSSVLTNTFLSMGVEAVTGNKTAFVNFPQDLLVKRIPLVFSRDRLVVEVLEDVKPELDVVEACREIAQKGFRLALDDFFYQEDLEPLIQLADTIKFDFRLTPVEEIPHIIRKLSAYNIQLLAEKVETHDEFNRAVELGFRYFQGYFFNKPEILKGRGLSDSKLNLLTIMAEANKEEVAFGKLESIISRDVSISYKLMRYINSAYFRRASEITSINQAIVLLGEKGIRRFLSLIAMAGLAADKPDELIRTSIIRAKFCELLGKGDGIQTSPSELFMLGLFSLIDAIMDNSMAYLIENIPLPRSIKEALIHHKGEMYPYLKLTICYEKGDWQEINKLTGALNVDENRLPEDFMEALNWADSFTAD